MGSLPNERINAVTLFQVVGIDFCGHFNLKVATIRKPLITKSHKPLYVCIVTKYIHPELVSVGGRSEKFQGTFFKKSCLFSIDV